MQTVLKVEQSLADVVEGTAKPSLKLSVVGITGHSDLCHSIAIK